MVLRRCVVAVLVLTAAVSGCTRDRGPVTLTVEPRTALMDVPVVTTVTGLDGGAAVTVEADAADADASRSTSGATATGVTLQLGGSDLDNGDAAGAARARLYALLESLG